MKIQQIKSRRHLSDQQIWQLISPGTDSGDIQVVDASIAEHLEQCAACREKLESSAAEPWLWDSASQILIDQGRDAFPAPLAGDTDHIQPGSERTNQRQLNSSHSVISDPELDDDIGIANEVIRGLLDSPSHPEMLGRIADYEIESAIGTGGSGVVFKGFDTELNRPVAIKVLAPRYSSIGAARKRFSREARAAAAICHENVVSIHRIDSSATHPFIVMPFIGGGSLQEFLEHHGPLDAVQVVQIGKQIAEGLAAAHDVGVIHRDIKPANILLENGCNRVLISDFGLAQVESDISLTRTGFIAGTPYYMSPEQAQGNPTDARSDLFSLGGILYFMATARPPFTANNAMAVLNKICKSKLVDVRHWNSQIPSALANLIHTLLEKNRDHRFRSATQITQVLTEYLAHLQLPTARKKPKVVAPKSMRRKRHSIAIVGGAMAAVILVGSVLLWGPWFNSPGNKLDGQNPLGGTTGQDSNPTAEPETRFGDGDQTAFDERVGMVSRGLDQLERAPTTTPVEPTDQMDIELNEIGQAVLRLQREQAADVFRPNPPNSKNK